MLQLNKDPRLKMKELVEIAVAQEHRLNGRLQLNTCSLCKIVKTVVALRPLMSSEEVKVVHKCWTTV